jgi:hypothetical protein
MTTTQAPGRVLTALLIAGGIGLAVAPAALAEPDPTGSEDPDAAGTAVQLPGTNSVPVANDAPEGIASACKAYSVALNYAAANYEDFAYNTAGNGNSVNYGDGSVTSANATGRTALRQAAAMAMQASQQPELPPDISTPMRDWSLRAAKLVLVMGLHGGGDVLNDTASDMNVNARDVQMACAKAGHVV